MRIAWEKLVPGPPARRRGVEYLDDPQFPPDERAKALADVARSNALFGGWSAIWEPIAKLIGQMPSRITLLDVGTGHGEIAAQIAGELGKRGITVSTIGLDIAPSVAARASATLGGALAGDARRLPFRDRSADLVICSQLLHHFEDADVRTILAELNRVSNRWVVVADLERSRIAAAGFSIASLALGFHGVTRHDGVVSVMRGFTEDELVLHIHNAVGAQNAVRRAAFWRLNAAWRVINEKGDTRRMPPLSQRMPLGPMPSRRAVRTLDVQLVRAPINAIAELAMSVEEWPRHLRHYRYVRFIERDGRGGLVEMSANRPFGLFNWPTWWTSVMEVDDGDAPRIRFRHVEGVTQGMDVEWRFIAEPGGTRVEIEHLWDGPDVPFGEIAARTVIGPVFVHGIASRTLAGLARVSEQSLTSGRV